MGTRQNGKLNVTICRNSAKTCKDSCTEKQNMMPNNSQKQNKRDAMRRSENATKKRKRSDAAKEKRKRRNAVKKKKPREDDCMEIMVKKMIVSDLTMTAAKMKKMTKNARSVKVIA